MAKFKEPLYNQARKEGLGHGENAIYHGHLGAGFPPLGPLFFGNQNVGPNACPNVDLVGPQKELPSSIIDLGVATESAIDLPT